MWVFAPYRYTQSVVERCLQENPQLANLWTPESNYSVRTSMYNKDARSQSVAPVMQRNLISGGANSQERDMIQNECNRIAQVASLFPLPMTCACNNPCMLHDVRTLLQLPAVLTWHLSESVPSS